jgi:hypothetical protein
LRRFQGVRRDESLAGGGNGPLGIWQRMLWLGRKRWDEGDEPL